MNILLNRPSTPEAAAIRERIFNVLPAATYQMEKLFGLFDIEFSEETQTACVECRATPRLLLNKAFLDEYCRDDGDLFLLILHELYHVILGHTRLFPRGSPIDNIVFDAVINSMLCRTVGRTVGTRLFTRINSYDSLPERLLRPPPGWPDDFKDALAALPLDEQRITGLLYGEAEPSEITYRDIYELLCKELAGCKVPKVLLLGWHGPDQNEDGLLKEAVRHIVEGWPPPPFRISGRDEGRSAENFWLRPAENPGRAFQKAFERVLHKCGIHAGRGPAVYRRQMTNSQRTVETVTAKRPRPADPRAALTSGASAALLPNRVIGTTAQAPSSSDRASLSGCQRIDDRVPALSLGRVPRTLQVRRAEDLRVLHRRIGTQGPRSEQGPDAEYVGNRHQRCARAHHWHPSPVPAKGHPNSHTTVTWDMVAAT